MKDLLNSLNAEHRQENKKIKHNKAKLEEMISSIEKHTVKENYLDEKNLHVIHFNNGLSIGFCSDKYCLIPPTSGNQYLENCNVSEKISSHIYSLVTNKNEKNNNLANAISWYYSSNYSYDLVAMVRHAMNYSEFEMAKARDFKKVKQNSINAITSPYDCYKELVKWPNSLLAKCVFYPIYLVIYESVLVYTIANEIAKGHISGVKFKDKNILTKKKTPIGLKFRGNSNNFEKIIVNIQDSNHTNAFFEINTEIYYGNLIFQSENRIRYYLKETTDYRLFPNQRENISPKYFLNPDYFQDNTLTELYEAARLKEELWQKWRTFKMYLDKEDLLFLKSLADKNNN